MARLDGGDPLGSELEVGGVGGGRGLWTIGAGGVTDGRVLFGP